MSTFSRDPEGPGPNIPDAEELPGDAAAVWSSWARPEEVDTFDEFVRRFWNKELTEEEFRLFRLQNGVYGQAQQDMQMVRVKIPAGGLTADQLDATADLAARTPRGVAHVTTRQNFQFHFVKLADAAQVLDRINAVGLTTREACANTIRTMTACHRAGVCPTEAFDVTPYATAASTFFLRNPLNQNLPRKFKISFSGCRADCALPLIHDIGVVAALQRQPDGSTRRGFQLYLGGGLGAQPKQARLLEEFTAADDLLCTMAAVVRVFDRVGNRRQKALARMKHAVERVGWEAFVELVLSERSKLKLTLGPLLPSIVPWEEARRPPLTETGAGRDGAAEDDAWLATNVGAQKQAGYVLVHVRLVLGDVTAAQLHALADVTRRFCDGTARTTIQQNIALRWVRRAAVAQVHAALKAAGLAGAGAERLADVTSCPGADTCQLGITSSRGLARRLTREFEEGLAAYGNLDGARIKISGCPNSCGQHHIAGIGLFGGAKKFGDRLAPTYQMMLGGTGNADAAATPFAKPFLKIPAANVSSAVAHLIKLYQRLRRPAEPLGAFVERYGWDKLKEEMSGYCELPPYEQAPEKYRDAATELEEVAGRRTDFEIKTGKGECGV